MKSFGALIVLVVSLVSCGGILSQAPHPLNTQQMVSHEGYSTVALVTVDDDNDDERVSDVRPTCSAVWVDDKHILTALHCAKGELKRQQARQDAKEKLAEEQRQAICDSPFAMLAGHLCDDDYKADHITVEMKGLSMHYIVWKEVDDVRKEPTGQHLGHVVGWDETHDLALIEAAGRAIPTHEIAKVATEVPGMGEKIHVCGHVKGMYWTFLEGSVAGYRGDIPALQPKHLSDGESRRTGPYLQLQVPIFFGNSGGGAFNENGELIGIADFLMNLPSEGFFVPVESIRAFLVDQEVLPGKVKKPQAEKVSDDKKDQSTVVIIKADTVVVPSVNVAPPPVEKADVIPAPPLPIPLPKTGGLGHVPTP